MFTTSLSKEHLMIVKNLSKKCFLKTILEKKVENLTYSGIEWRALTKLKLSMEQNEKIEGILTSLDELDDVQNIFTNAKLEN